MIDIRIGVFGTNTTEGVGIYEDGKVVCWRSMDMIKKEPLRLSICAGQMENKNIIKEV